MAQDLASTPAGWDYAERIQEVVARIRAAEIACGRQGAGVRLLVATKSWDADAATAVVRAGGVLVGESRMQELEAKGEALAQAGAEIHVIGHVQRNKAAIAARWARCIQSLDSWELAQKLSRLALEAERDLEVMVQVNVSGEDTKAGVSPDDALSFAHRVQSLPGLTVTGWMTVGLNSRDEEAVRQGYRRLRRIRDKALIDSERGLYDLRDAWELSMGMSNDLEWAIAEGASIVRVGTAVMGRRTG